MEERADHEGDAVERPPDRRWGRGRQVVEGFQGLLGAAAYVYALEIGGHVRVCIGFWHDTGDLYTRVSLWTIQID